MPGLNTGCSLKYSTGEGVGGSFSFSRMLFEELGLYGHIKEQIQCDLSCTEQKRTTTFLLSILVSLARVAVPGR